MKTLALILLSFAGAAHAQFKCVDAGGGVSFQQAPCPGAQKQQAIKLRTEAPADAGFGSPAVLGQSMDERILASMMRERRVRELEQAVADVDFEVNQNNARMSNEMAAVRDVKRYAKNNLAGATWEQSLSTEMQAIAAKYKALNDGCFERLKVLRSDLESARKVALK